MAKSKELDQFLNDQAAQRSHIKQYEAPAGKDTQRLISWYLIERDLDEMINCMDLVYALGKTRGASLLVISALWEKTIIGYGRIYGSSEDGYTTLQTKMVDTGDLPLHKNLMEVRNSYLAHRGDNDYENHKLILSVEGTEENCHIQFVVPWTKVVGQHGNPVIVRKYFKRIRKMVKRKLADMKESYEKRIFEELGLTPNLE